MPHPTVGPYYALSFFEVERGRLARGREYWVEERYEKPAPERAHWFEPMRRHRSVQATRVSCEKTHSHRPFSRARTSVARSRVLKPRPMNCPLLVVIAVTTAVSPWTRTSTSVDSSDS